VPTRCRKPREKKPASTPTPRGDLRPAAAPPPLAGGLPAHEQAPSDAALALLLRIDGHLVHSHIGPEHPARREIAEAMAVRVEARARPAPTARPGELPPAEIYFRILAGELHRLPDSAAALLLRPLPAGTPVPRMGEAVILASTTAWGVTLVLHEWLAGGRLRVEVWLEYVGASHATRPASCALCH